MFAFLFKEAAFLLAHAVGHVNVERDVEAGHDMHSSAHASRESRCVRWLVHVNHPLHSPTLAGFQPDHSAREQADWKTARAGRLDPALEPPAFHFY